MRRQLIMCDIATGFMGCEVEVSVSRDERTGVWTIYFHSLDQDAPGTIRHKAKTSADFLDAFKERGVHIATFCDELNETGDLDLVALGQAVRQEDADESPV